jgi:electron transport complex protein RnfB
MRAEVKPGLDRRVNRFTAGYAPGSMEVTASGRVERLASRTRNPKWKPVPLWIDMEICINCDTCIRHCPPQFGAIFNHGMDVVIIPELCSGCGKCLDPCPVDCIHPDPDWTPAPEDWWEEPARDDPYT